MPRPAARYGAAVLAAALLTAASFAGVTVPAAVAHDVLVASSPADGATVAPPEAVTLTFDNAVQSDFAQVAVLGPDETPYQEGAAEVAGTTVTQPVGDLPAGEFTVSYRVVSSDGHPVSGTYSFTVAAGTAPTAEPTDVAPTSPPPNTAPSTPVADETPAAEDEADGTPGTVTIVGMIAGAAVAGAAAAAAFRRWGRRTEPRG